VSVFTKEQNWVFSSNKYFKFSSESSAASFTIGQHYVVYYEKIQRWQLLSFTDEQLTCHEKAQQTSVSQFNRVGQVSTMRIDQEIDDNQYRHVLVEVQGPRILTDETVTWYMLIQQKQEKPGIRLSFEALIFVFSCFHLNQHQLSCHLSHEDEMNRIMRFY
jgi:hypothetical protein